MTPIQIDSMIDRICGMYPTTPVPRNGMKALWREDALLLSIDVKQGREVMGLIERHNAIPSLPEIKGMVRTLLKEVVESLPTCTICMVRVGMMGKESQTVLFCMSVSRVLICVAMFARQLRSVSVGNKFLTIG